MGVPLEYLGLLAVCRVGDADRFVSATGGEKLSIRRELHAEHTVAMTVGPVLEQLAAGYTPQCNVSAAGWLSTARDQSRAIRAETHRVRAIGDGGFGIARVEASFQHPIR